MALSLAQLHGQPALIQLQRQQQPRPRDHWTLASALVTSHKLRLGTSSTSSVEIPQLRAMSTTLLATPRPAESAVATVRQHRQPWKTTAFVPQLKSKPVRNAIYVDDKNKPKHSVLLVSSFIFTIALKTEPWQWTSDYSTPSNVSYLQTSTTDMYIDYKMRIEKAVS